MAFFKMYKPGQGKWVRGLSAAGIALLVAFGVFWFMSELDKFVSENKEYWQGGFAVGIVAFFAVFTWWLLNKPRVADFMIATETEMRKVNWPGKKEILGSTWVVIAGTLMIVAVLFVVDLGFATFFQKIGILDAG